MNLGGELADVQVLHFCRYGPAVHGSAIPMAGWQSRCRLFRETGPQPQELLPGISLPPEPLHHQSVERFRGDPDQAPHIRADHRALAH
jgi:hypothetical protein